MPAASPRARSTSSRSAPTRRSSRRRRRKAATWSAWPPTAARASRACWSEARRTRCSRIRRSPSWCAARPPGRHEGGGDDMKTTMQWILAAAALAAAPVLAAGPDACANDPAAKGLPARVQNMHEKMDRIHWATDLAEQRRLLDLHGKLMHEGMQELGRRKTTLP